jgi:sulfide dehydrogenase cytochrome subunit
LKKYLVILLFGSSILLFANNTQAKMLSLSCMNCHGSNGVSTSAMPSIAGIDKKFLYKTLISFKKNKIENTIMRHHTRGFSNKELKMIADYYSKQRGK